MSHIKKLMPILITNLNDCYKNIICKILLTFLLPYDYIFLNKKNSKSHLKVSFLEPKVTKNLTNNLHLLYDRL